MITRVFIKLDCLGHTGYLTGIDFIKSCRSDFEVFLDVHSDIMLTALTDLKERFNIFGMYTQELDRKIVFIHLK